MFIVYMHKTPEHKSYIGITQDISKRWRKGEGYKTNEPFYADIQRFGWDNITHTILADSLSYDEATALEAKYIDQYGTTSQTRGYNRYKSTTEYRPKTSDEIDYIRSKNPSAKRIQKINDMDQVIAEYPSISVAAREIHGSQPSLSACINGRLKTYKGFRWKLVDK